MNLAFVLLSKAQLPKAEEVTHAFGRFATTEDQRLRLTGTNPEAKTDAELLEFELSPGGVAFVALMPFAVPKGEAEDGVRFSVSALGTDWKLPAHSAHLVVTLKDTTTISAIEALSRFTSLLAVVTEVSGAVGVYWGRAGATHHPRFFTSTAENRDVTSRVALWTGVSLAREADGRLSMLSLGMRQLDLPDLLLIAPKSADNSTLETFFDLLAYTVENGKPLPEGDTVGRTADERLPVYYILFRKYPICTFSGELGPKLREGDRQSPEGFYTVGPAQLNPDSRFHLSFNLGFPNPYERARGWTGSALMVHGNCVSIGCYAMTDNYIEEIYAFADASLRNGQREFQVHVFPFRMTPEKMRQYQGAKWYSFWTELKVGYDLFQKHGVPPKVRVRGRQYLVTVP